MPAPDDPVLACLQIETDCPVGQTTTTERVYRDVIGTANEWNVGDTIIVKLQAPATNCLLVGWERSELGSTGLYVQNSNMVSVTGTTSGLGTITATFTLTSTAPDGDTLKVCYRTGVPGAYVSLAQDRGLADIDMHSVDIDNPISYVEVYGRTHQWAGDPNLPDILRVAGMGLQTDPPA